MAHPSTQPIKPKDIGATDWWNPSTADQLKFCVATGFPKEYAAGWPGGVPNEPNTWQGKIAPLSQNATDDEIRTYHGMGFVRDGHRNSWTMTMLIDARTKCDQLKAATTPAEQDAIAGAGASNLPSESVRILLMGQGAGNSAYYGPLKDDPTVSNCASFCVGTYNPFTSGVAP